jgi:DUF971 family protein
MAERKTPTKEQEREGIVVWDQRGLVVVWPDGQSSRFSWETLQHLSLCTMCHNHGAQPSSESQYSPQLT